MQTLRIQELIDLQLIHECDRDDGFFTSYSVDSSYKLTVQNNEDNGNFVHVEYIQVLHDAHDVVVIHTLESDDPIVIKSLRTLINVKVFQLTTVLPQLNEYGVKS